jgi:hypothetical protein
VSLPLRTPRPVGITLIVSFYITKVVFYIEKTLVRLDHRFYRFILDGAGIRDLVIALFSLFVVIGLMRMQSWGRMLAIIVSGILAAWSGGFLLLDITMGFWTLLPGSLWANTQAVVILAFEICGVWYLLRSETREIFRAAQSPSIVNADQA